MKKQLTVFMATAMLAGAMGTTGFAADANPAGGNTEVYIGVTKTTPDSISVTVPTSLAIAVVDDSNSPIETLMGNYMVDGSGNVINSGDSAQGIKDQRVTFVNNGTVDAKVVSAKIINSKGSKWTITDAPTAMYDISMALNGFKAGTIKEDSNNIITLNEFTLEKNKTTHMKAKVDAAGKDENGQLPDKIAAGTYTTSEASAKSFIIEWNIAAK